MTDISQTSSQLIHSMKNIHRDSNSKKPSNSSSGWNNHYSNQAHFNPNVEKMENPFTSSPTPATPVVTLSDATASLTGSPTTASLTSSPKFETHSFTLAPQNYQNINEHFNTPNVSTPMESYDPPLSLDSLRLLRESTCRDTPSATIMNSHKEEAKLSPKAARTMNGLVAPIPMLFDEEPPSAPLESPPKNKVSRGSKVFDCSVFDPLLSGNGPTDFLATRDPNDGTIGAPIISPLISGKRASITLPADNRTETKTVQLREFGPKDQTSLSLLQIAKELSVVKPRAETEEEAQERSRKERVETLGKNMEESTGQSPNFTSRMKLLGENLHMPHSTKTLGGTREHRRSKSTPMNHGSSKKWTESICVPLSPKHLSKSKVAKEITSKFAKKFSKVLKTPKAPQQKLLTKERHSSRRTTAPVTPSTPLSVSPPESSPSSINDDTSIHSSSSIPDIALALSEADNQMRSSELDPMPHQVELPKDPSELLMHIRLCNILDMYRKIDQNLDFGTFVEMNRDEIESFVKGNSDSHSSDEGGTLSVQHQPIAKQILECDDDLVVEGFFHEVGDEIADINKVVSGPADKCTLSRTEVAVFSSQQRRQFIVVYQGTAEQQTKPVRSKELKYAREMNSLLRKETDHSGSKPEGQADKEDASVSSTFSPYWKGYNKKGLEERVFGLLDDLSEKYPFFDVFFTGHSFGAAIATIGATRYSRAFPMIRVSCHAFGSPRVGGIGFRLLAHSLPNLKIIRIEYGFDPWCLIPDGPAWTHVGHTVAISPKIALNEKLPAETTSSVVIQAYMFDKARRNAGSKKIIHKMDNTLKLAAANFSQEGKADHGIQSYLDALVVFSRVPRLWVQHYVGNFEYEEKRLVC